MVHRFSTLVVNENGKDYSIFDLIYPVGSLFFSVGNKNPSELSGGPGVWEQIQGKFILASDLEHEANTTGGLATNQTVTQSYIKMSDEDESGDEGGIPMLPSDEDNNLPPYLSVNVWKRLS